VTDCGFSSLDFDIAASAGWYSAIAGLLAGFALLAILLPLDHASEMGADDTDDTGLIGASESVVMFTCAFFSLLILGFTYAILAGRTGEGAIEGVAAHEQLLNGAAFGLATLLLLLGLRAVLATYGPNRQVFRPARSVMLGMTAFLGPVAALSLQFTNALDIERYRASLRGGAESCGSAGIPTGVWINLSITAATLLALVVLAVIHRRLPRTVGASVLIAKGVLGFCVLVVVWSSLVVPLLPTSVVAGAVFEHVTLAATGVATLLVAAAAWSTR
jgi:hypothetical protein